jgi:anthranilate phosphoribosyltransferase
MPVATICVQAAGFVLGLAHRNVTLSATGLLRIRPDLTTGVVASTELSPGETIDEYSEVGVVHMARNVNGKITRDIYPGADVTRRWRRSVAHRSTHRANAALVTEVLTAGSNTAATRLAELNAALTVATGNGTGMIEAIKLVNEVRESGRAMRYLTTLAR